MDLLPIYLRTRLPSLPAIENDMESQVWFRFTILGTKLSWFVMAGEFDGRLCAAIRIRFWAERL